MIHFFISVHSFMYLQMSTSIVISDLVVDVVRSLKSPVYIYPNLEKDITKLYRYSDDRVWPGNLMPRTLKLLSVVTGNIPPYIFIESCTQRTVVTIMSSLAYERMKRAPWPVTSRGRKIPSCRGCDVTFTFVAQLPLFFNTHTNATAI